MRLFRSKICLAGVGRPEAAVVRRPGRNRSCRDTDKVRHSARIGRPCNCPRACVVSACMFSEWSAFYFGDFVHHCHKSVNALHRSVICSILLDNIQRAYPLKFWTSFSTVSTF